MTKPADVPAVTITSGARMHMVGFGTWKLRGRSAYDGVQAALEAGYRHIDTATMYGNEAEVGQALRASGLDRSELFVTTKIRPSDGGRVRSVLQASLHALDTDYLDLWLIHWPPQRLRASRELWQDLLAAKAAGQVRDVGVSNYSLAQLDDLASWSGQPAAVNQVHWNPARYDAAMLAGHEQRSVALEGYSPLRDTRLDDPVLTEIAAAHHVTAAQVVLRWHLEHDITVIPKSAQRERIAANIDLFGFRLADAETTAIDGLARR